MGNEFSVDTDSDGVTYFAFCATKRLFWLMYSFQKISSTDMFERIPYVANKKRGVDSYHLRFETYHSLSL